MTAFLFNGRRCHTTGLLEEGVDHRLSVFIMCLKRSLGLKLRADMETTLCCPKIGDVTKLLWSWISRPIRLASTPKSRQQLTSNARRRVATNGDELPYATINAISYQGPEVT